jgi:uncharacterized protein YbjT (DUF2867 family)
MSFVELCCIKNSKMKIVITGSLGHISKPLTTTLVQAGCDVTVVSSKSEKLKEIEALGATGAIGALQDLTFLAGAFEGADAVYAMVPPNPGAADIRGFYRQIGNNYAQAIGDAGVRRVVFLSSMGADLDKGTGPVLGSHDIEGILDGLSGVAVTHLRPGYFYYNLYNYVGQIKGLGLIRDNFGGQDSVVMVAPDDIAAVAAEELQATGSVARIRYIASDERTAKEVARVLGAAIGMPDLKWMVCSDEERLEELAKFGVPPAFAAGLVELTANIHSGVFYRDYHAHKIRPAGSVKLEDFVREFAAAFKQENVAQHG